MQTLSLDSIPAVYTMASELYKSGKYEDAKDLFSLLTASEIKNTKHWMGLAACYQMTREYPKAIECYSMAAIQNKNAPLAHWHAAECYFANGNVKLALTALSSAIKLATPVVTLQPLVQKMLGTKAIWERSKT